MEVFWAAFGGGLAGGTAGLVGATIVELTRWWLSRPKLQVRASWTLRFDESGTASKLLVIQASNVRSRPLTISECGFHHRVGFFTSVSLSFPDEELPKRLLEGESYSAYIEPARLEIDFPDGLLIGGYSPDIDQNKVAFVSTSDGREFRSKLKFPTARMLATSSSEYATQEASAEP